MRRIATYLTIKIKQNGQIIFSTVDNSYLIGISWGRHWFRRGSRSL